MILSIKNTALLILLILLSLDLCAQRKDSDAKISIGNNVRSARGQRKKIADAELRVRYAFNALDMNDKSTWIDEGQLKISPHLTDYSSHFVEVNEDSLACWFDIHGTNVAYPATVALEGYRRDYWIEYQYSQITTEGKILTEWATMPQNLDYENLFYTEELPLFDWKISSESKTICGYRCIKATCRWRGRDYTAWFTPDIPVTVGPWKFGGLPGLIMKVSDNDGIYAFEAVAVEKGTFPIFAPRGSKYKLSTREKVQKLQRQLNEDYIKHTGAAVFDYKTGQPILSRKHKYSQMELE